MEASSAEAEGGGMTEIAFAAVGLQVRLDTLQGEIQTAAEVLSICRYNQK